MENLKSYRMYFPPNFTDSEAKEAGLPHQLLENTQAGDASTPMMRIPVKDLPEILMKLLLCGYSTRKIRPSNTKSEEYETWYTWYIVER